MERTLSYKVVGTSSLLQNNPAAMLKGKDGPKKPKNPTPEEDADRSLYLTKRGKCTSQCHNLEHLCYMERRGKKLGRWGYRVL